MLYTICYIIYCMLHTICYMLCALCYGHDLGAEDLHAEHVQRLDALSIRAFTYIYIYIYPYIYIYVIIYTHTHICM